jgi:hypothetical protein
VAAHSHHNRQMLTLSCPLHQPMLAFHTLTILTQQRIQCVSDSLFNLLSPLLNHTLLSQARPLLSLSTDLSLLLLPPQPQPQPQEMTLPLLRCLNFFSPLGRRLTPKRDSTLRLDLFLVLIMSQLIRSPPPLHLLVINSQALIHPRTPLLVHAHQRCTLCHLS